MLRFSYPFVPYRDTKGVRLSLVSDKEDCGIVFYDKKTQNEIQRIPFTKQDRMGTLYFKYIDQIDFSKVTYQFYEEDRLLPDSFARGYAKDTHYGTPMKEEDLKAVFQESTFDWEKDENPRIPYHDAICYCLHVRGFTKDPSSKVKHKGCFEGIIEKIPYLKECGITTLELQPVYEFLEMEETTKNHHSIAPIVGERLNYWGYKKGYYYAPKAAYSDNADASFAFKQLVKKLHENHMEVILQFYFPDQIKRLAIFDVLRFWVAEYHVDGFHLMGNQMPVSLIAQDPVLSGTKIWYYGFDEEIKNPGLGIYCDDYLYVMRHFLKGDEGMLPDVMYHMRNIPSDKGHIHYMTNYYGFTLWDLVSYDRKHNEENGEENRDGNDYNYSWNCGEEGQSRKKKVMTLRKKQVKNALTLLMLSQSTPLIFMGDEFCNTQNGNNNPYCQDNSTTWLNWKRLEQNKEIFEYFKTLVSLRKEHPILHPQKEAKMMDYLSCGYPDVSYHGESAWQPLAEAYQRRLGILYCGNFAPPEGKEEDQFIYVGMNLYWEPCMLALPRLPKGLKWQLFSSTAKEVRKESTEALKALETKAADAVANVITCAMPNTETKGIQGTSEETQAEETIQTNIDARSISIFVSVPDPEVKKNRKSTKKKGN